MKHVFLSAAFAILLVPQGAFAHATPVTYEPAASAVLTSSPDHVKIIFSERVESGASDIVVYGPDGSRIDQDVAVVDPADPRALSVTVLSGSSGTRVVSWQVVSADDGHYTKGAFLYSVGAESSNVRDTGSQVEVIHRTDIPEAFTIFLELLGQALLLGALIANAGIWRRLREKHQESAYARRLTVFVTTGAALILLGGFLFLVYRTQGMSLTNDLGFTENLETFLGTVTGRYTVYRMILGMIFLFAFFVQRKRFLKAEKISSSGLILLALLLLSALLRARVSHAAASSFLPGFSIIINALHLVAKDAWIGTVAAFTVLQFPLIDRRRDARSLGIAFTMLSRIVAAGFCVGGVTGAYIAWLHLKSPANILSTHWGVTFVSLGVFALLLLLIRLYQQHGVDSASVEYCKGKHIRMERLRYSGAVLLTESLTGLMVLFLSSLLIITTPPLSHRALYQQSSQSRDAIVTFGEHPYDDEFFLITVDDPSAASATVTLENAERGIGPIVVPVEKRFGGGFAFPKADLSLPGDWVIGVTAPRDGSYDAVAAFDIRYPDDLFTSHRYDDSRTFGGFELLCVLIALAIILASFWLWRLAAKMRALCISCSVKKIESAGMAATQWWGVVFVDVLLLVFLAYHLTVHGQGAFQRACVQVGGFWHENVPMESGRVISPVPVLGCMVGAGRGQFHFADAREFAQFLKPAHSKASMDLAPARPVAGQTVTFTFRLTNELDQPLTDLRIEHDRILHTVIIGQDLETFSHVHAENNGPVTQKMLNTSTFPVQAVFPKAGRYLVAVDWTVRVKSFSQEFYVTVGGADAMKPGAPDDSSVQTVDGYTVALNAPAKITSGSPQKFSFIVSKDGVPVTDLQPYLAAPMHLSIVKNDLRAFIHTHGELPQALFDRIFNPRNPKAIHIHTQLPVRFGPDLDAYVTFPGTGKYTIFGQFMAGGVVHLVRFGVTVK